MQRRAGWLTTAAAVTIVLSPTPDARLIAQSDPFPHVVSTSDRVIEGRRVVERDEFAGLRAREMRCVERICTGRWFDAARVYAVDANDTAIPLDAERSQIETSAAAVMTMMYDQPAFRAAGGTVEGEAPLRLRVRAAGGRPVTVTLDPATHLPERIEDDEGGTVATLGDYRRVGPLRLPFRIVGPGGALQYDDRRIEAAPLAAPKGLSVRFAATAPLRFTGRLPIVPCTLAGVRLRCLLDTGTSVFSLGLRTVERLHLTPFGESEVRGIGRFATALVESGPLLVGGAAVEHARFAVIADGPPGVDVILGTDLFMAASVLVDYPRGEVTLFAPEPAHSPRAGLAVEYRALRPEVAVTLDGLATRLVVDTGDVAGVDIPYAFYRTHAAVFTLGGERASAAGIGGTSDVLTGEVHRVALGSERALEVPLWVTRSLREERGHLGAALLSRFAVFFDLAHDRIALESASPAGERRDPGR